MNEMHDNMPACLHAVALHKGKYYSRMLYSLGDYGAFSREGPLGMRQMVNSCFAPSFLPQVV